MLTEELFNKLPAGHVFAKGIMEQSFISKVLTDTKLLQWIAYKDFVGNWRIYYYSYPSTIEKIVTNGIILDNINSVIKLVFCDTNVLNRYKYKV